MIDEPDRPQIAPHAAYQGALRDYLAGGGEAELALAYSIGRQAISEGLTSLIALHGEALRQVMRRTDLQPEQLVWIIDRSTQFLEEAVAPFEMTVRGFQETNHRLREANEQLRRADQLKDRFIAQMSHELRTPLNSILGFSDLLLSGAAGGLDDRQRRYVANVRASGTQLLQLVNDLLDLSKIRAGRLDVSLEALSLAPLIEECLAQVRPLAAARSIQLDADCSGQLRVVADRRRLAQVFLNLLSNGIKFTPEGGRVSMSAAAMGGGWIRTAVQDTGIGIPVEDQAKVFEEFTRLESGQVAAPGTGLGLPLSKQLVELMGGRIELHSEPGRGSVFAVLLPGERNPEG